MSAEARKARPGSERGVFAGRRGAPTPNVAVERKYDTTQKRENHSPAEPPLDDEHPDEQELARTYLAGPGRGMTRANREHLHRLRLDRPSGGTDATPGGRP